MNKTYDNNNHPSVSIGMPVFNGERYIAEAIDSLLAQSFTDFELIISDNSSTDKTSTICNNYAKNDSRIVFIRQDINIGPTANFEFVLKKASGDFFMWAAHDDLWESNWIYELTKNFNSNDIGIRGRVVTINNRGKALSEYGFSSFNYKAVIRVFMENEKKHKNFYVYSLFDRKKLIATGLKSFYGDYYPDYVFVTALIMKGALRKIPTTTQYYRIHNTNLSQSYNLPWLGIKRLIYKAHPLRYYQSQIAEVEFPLNVFLFCLTPIKHIKTQGEVWARGIKYLLIKSRGD